MAGRWRRLLEEESEHQWLTLSMFALFVLFGAFAIDATEHFVGDRITKVWPNIKAGWFLTSNITRTTHPTPPLSSLQEQVTTCLPSMSMTGQRVWFTVLKALTLRTK